MAEHLDCEYVSPAAAGLSNLLTSPAADSQDPGRSVQVPRSDQTTILNNHHDKFRKKLNFKSILSLLNESGLIPHEEYTKLLNIPPTETNYDKIDKLIAIIPSCDHDDFLMRLILCLRKSVVDAGDAHEELADSLQEALDRYVSSISPPPTQDDGDTSSKEDGNEFEILIVNHSRDSRSILTVGPGNPSIRQGRCRQRCCLWSCCYFIPVVAFVLGIVGMVSLSQLPQSTSAPPFPLQRVSYSLTELELGLNTGWISTVKVRLDSGTISDQCTGTVHVIPERTCDSLPTQVEQLGPPSSRSVYNLIYLLVGSQINITVESDFNAKSVWLLSSISALNYFNEFSLPDTVNCDYRIARQDNDYRCFEAEKYKAMSPIVFNVQHSGYYSVFIPTYIQEGLSISVAARTYNLTAIVEQNLISRNSTVLQGSTRQFNVNNPWEFTGGSCVLYASDCNRLTTTNLTILGVEKRRDVLLFPALLFVCGALLLIPLIIFHVLCFRMC